MELIRSKSQMTRLLILLEIVLKRPNDQRSISKTLEITPQGVSEYLHTMQDEGLVDLSGKAPSATVEGVQILQSSLLQLKDFVDSNISRLDIIRSTDAIASGDIRIGERVGLFMNDGLLYAGEVDGCSSWGIAEMDALDGELVGVSELTGVLELPTPTLVLLSVVPARQGGRGQKFDGVSWKVERSRIENELGVKVSFRTAVMDLEAASVMKRSSYGYEMEMPGPETLVTTLQRGVPLFCAGTPFSISKLKRDLSPILPRCNIIELDPMEFLKK
jgi:putative transcriptional regulator